MKTDLELVEAHKYVTEHGRKPAPGVTTITNHLSKEGLQWGASKLTATIALDEAYRRDAAIAEHRERRGWRNEQRYPDGDVYFDYLRTEFDRRWKAKADRGTRLHNHALSWSKGEQVEALPDEEGFLDALQRFHEECKPEFLRCEDVVVNPMPNGERSNEYGGRTDALAVLHAGEHTGICLLDYKTGAYYLESLALQLSGYEHAKFATYTDDGALGKLEPMPEIMHALGVYLHDDGTYELKDPFEHLLRVHTWTTFLGLRAAHNWRREVASIENADRKMKKAA